MFYPGDIIIYDEEVLLYVEKAFDDEIQLRDEDGDYVVNNPPFSTSLYSDIFRT